MNFIFKTIIKKITITEHRTDPAEAQAPCPQPPPQERAHQRGHLAYENETCLMNLVESRAVKDGIWALTRPGSLEQSQLRSLNKPKNIRT